MPPGTFYKINALSLLQNQTNCDILKTDDLKGILNDEKEIGIDH